MKKQEMMLDDYQVGCMIFYDGDVGKYFYGTILSVETNVKLNHVYMKVLNKNADVFSLNLNEETMKQWVTEHPVRKCPANVIMQNS